MLSKQDFFKVLIATQAMENELREMNENVAMLLHVAKENAKGKTETSQALEEAQISEAVRANQYRQELEKQFSILYGMVDDFVQANFDWCQEHLSEEYQEFVEMA